MRGKRNASVGDAEEAGSGGATDGSAGFLKAMAGLLLCAAAGVESTAAGLGAQEAPAPFVLVGNLGQPDAFELGSRPDHGRWQAFTTGSAAGGYRLGSVAVVSLGSAGWPLHGAPGAGPDWQRADP